MDMNDRKDDHGATAIPDLARMMQAEIDDAHASLIASDASTPTHILDRLAWFRDLRLTGKLHAIFGAFFATGFAMVLILSLGLTELWMRGEVSTAVDDAVVSSTDLRGTAGELRYNTVRFIFGGEGDLALQRQRESFAQAQEHMAAVNAIVEQRVPQLSENAQALSASLVEYNSIFEELRATMESAPRSEQSVSLAYELSAKGDALFEQSRQFTDLLAGYGDEVRKSSADYFVVMISITAVLALISSAILLLGLSYLSRNFSHRVVEISGWMQRLAKGDRHFDVTGHSRKDELGDMANSIELFKRANRKLEVWARERSERADEQLRQQKERELERKEEENRKTALLNEVAKQFEHTIGEVAEGVAVASSQLQSTATQMAASAEQSTTGTATVSKNMQDANMGATAAASASDEFALSIGEISRQAASSSELARVAAEATTKADATISELSESAEQVGEIVELIQTIAQRTNLLALNASIEAARGGEAGRGFAVVASEVKELAMQTSRATDQVAEQIRAIQDKTGASVTALRSIAGQVHELETTAVSIASAVDQQSVAGQDLARSIDMAARGTEKVASHIEDVRELSLSTGSAASQVLASANELEQQASIMREQVDSFLKRVRAS